MKSVLLPYAL